jgi:hypothetical protein
MEQNGGLSSARTIGLAVGAMLGIVWAWLGLGAVLLVGVLAIAGWFIGGVVGGATEGTVNLGDVWNDLRGRRRA